ncbi:carbohydrate ABC transporter permease [Agromyces albus]|uniref:Sugar ABC transporter permease n=1 Tax=Agromyces albus TaxID=205332 RepID=A0A4Q2KW45_9MICO|nr:sugar ABC transporter permease [Agromyces albus]MDQ0577682.1 raffinose/stachyose/melibiose transport system permease protein [Agromyces albus]RXZ67701.1 sugar ABC transporter permease [Agromyces albus]
MKSVLGDRRAIAILLGPALLVYTLVMLVPVVWSFGYTFVKGNPLEGFRFSGIDNFARLFVDPDIRDALFFTIKYAVVMTAGQVIIGYGLALLYIFVLRRSSVLIRTLVFFPVVVPTVAIALLFQKLFQSAPRDGVVNELLVNVGLGSVDWLGQADTAFLVIVVMDIWRSVGFYAVLLFAGLIDIPEDIIESARIDGARHWSLFRHIIVPLSLPILFSSIIFSINGTIKVFDSVLALTGGQPGNSTTPLTLYMYRTAFAFSDYGYGSTIALLLTIMCLLVTIVIFRSARRDITN